MLCLFLSLLCIVTATVIFCNNKCLCAIESTIARYCVIQDTGVSVTAGIRQAKLVQFFRLQFFTILCSKTVELGIECERSLFCTVLEGR